MTRKRQTGYPVPVSDVANALLDPVMRGRAGISVGLVQSWDEIAGERLAAHTRPEKIVWPRRAGEDDPFQPATLVIACNGAAALRLQHETGEIIGRVNGFLGFNAIGRIRMVQKPVVNARPRERPAPRALTDEEKGRLARTIEAVDDENLRASLERLGRSVLGSKDGGKAS